MTAFFGHPDMSSIAAATAEEREQLDEMFQTRVEADVRRGRWRGHFYQLTADLIMLEHRPDYAKRFYDTIPAFRNRLRDTGEESLLVERDVREFVEDLKQKRLLPQ